MFAPYEVQLAKEPTKDAACDAEEDKDQIVHRLVFSPVVSFKQDKFASTSGIEELQNDCCSQATKKSAPKDLAWEVCADLNIVSAENRTKLANNTSS